MQIYLELLISTLTKNKISYKQQLVNISNIKTDPDQYVLDRVLNLNVTPEIKNIISHSTSWRYEDEKIILTYLIYIPQTAKLNIKLENTTTQIGKIQKGTTLKPRPKQLMTSSPHCASLIRGILMLRYS